MNAATLAANPLVPAHLRSRLAAHAAAPTPPADVPAEDSGEPEGELVVDEPLPRHEDETLRADIAALKAQLAEMATPPDAPAPRQSQFDDRVSGAMTDTEYKDHFGDDEPTTTQALIRREVQANNARLVAQFEAALEALQTRVEGIVSGFARVEKTAKDTTVSTAIPRLSALLQDKAFKVFLLRKVPFGVNGETFQQRASLAYDANDVDTLKAIVAAFDKATTPRAKTPGFSEPPATGATPPQRSPGQAQPLTHAGLKLLNHDWRMGKISQADYYTKFRAYDAARAAGTLV